MAITGVLLLTALCASTVEAACLDSNTTASPIAEEQLQLNADNSLTTPPYPHNTSSSTQRPSASSTLCQVTVTSTQESGHISTSASTSGDNSTTQTGCSLTTATSYVTPDPTAQLDITRSAVDDTNSSKSHIRDSTDGSINASSSTDSILADRKSTAKPEITKLCCIRSTLTTESGATEHANDSTVVTSSSSAGTTSFVSYTTTEQYRHSETTTANLSVTETYLEDFSGENSDNHPAWTAAVLNYENVTTSDGTSSIVWTTSIVTDSVHDLPHNRTFNFVFDGDCRALKRRGQEAEKRFRSVVVDALSSGLSISSERLVAGDLRCGSLNLSVTLLNAYDDDVHWMMSTLAAATLRVSVEDVDETFVLLRVELVPLQRIVTRVMSGQVATTSQPNLGQASVAILVVFIIIGALAVLAGTVSAAIYLYFRRMYCRTFVVNRRALRWSSRASDTVQVINVDDDDGSSGGGASSRTTANDDAVEWSPPISVSGFDDGRLPVAFANWSPHYCQARFRRLIAPPATALMSLPELLDDDATTVDIIASNSSFHPHRQSSVINLLQPHQLHIGSTDDNEDIKDDDYQTEMRKQELSLNGDITLDWSSQDFSTSSKKKQRATPF